eukprot:360471-Chlamydomonas_euryale.AAC.7
MAAADLLRADTSPSIHPSIQARSAKGVLKLHRVLRIGKTSEQPLARWPTRLTHLGMVTTLAFGVKRETMPVMRSQE